MDDYPAGAGGPLPPVPPPTPTDWEAADSEPAWEQRSDMLTAFYWEAAGTRHHPLYFEDVNLERHGHSFGQPKDNVINRMLI